MSETTYPPYRSILEFTVKKDENQNTKEVYVILRETKEELKQGETYTFFLGPEIITKESKNDKITFVKKDETLEFDISSFISDDKVKQTVKDALGIESITLQSLAPISRSFQKDISKHLLEGKEFLDIFKKEKDYVSKRKMKFKISWSKLLKILNTDVAKNIDKLPNIGICSSGGGCRAMVGSLAALCELESTGLIELISHWSGVSGGSWTILGLMEHESDKDIVSFSKYSEFLKDKLKNSSKTSKILSGGYSLFNSVYNWKISTKSKSNYAAMTYGHYLAQLFYKDPKKKAYSAFSDFFESKMIKEHAIPYPLLTAHVVKDGKEKKDNLFTPIEWSPLLTGFPEHNLYIQTPLFGGEYNAGEFKDSKVAGHSDLNSYLMAICGSAFFAHRKDIVPTSTQNNKSHFEKLYDYFFNEKDTKQEELENQRFINPTLEKNILYKTDKENLKWLNDKDMSLADAGIDINIPIVSGMMEKRELDILLILDNSAFTEETKFEQLELCLNVCEKLNLIDKDQSRNDLIKKLKESKETKPYYIFQVEKKEIKRKVQWVYLPIHLIKKIPSTMAFEFNEEFFKESKELFGKLKDDFKKVILKVWDEKKKLKK